jgi:hypothetical protein
MKKFTFYWRFLTLVLLLFSVVSVTYADTDEISGSVTCTSDYVSCGTTDVDFNLTFVSPDWEYGWELTMVFPDGITLNSASTINGKSAVITGQQIYWPMHFYSSSESIDFSINLSADETIIGDQNVSYLVNGDGWGDPPHSFSGITVMQEDPNTTPALMIDPIAINLGDWPIGGWQEYQYLELTNAGSGVAYVTASEIDDADRAFKLEDVSLPAAITNCGSPLMIGVAMDPAAANVDGVTYDATYVASWGDTRSVVTADVSVTAYQPQYGDIFEDPMILNYLDWIVPTPLNNNSREYNGYYKNYTLPADVAAGDHDMVFEITVDADVMFNMSALFGVNTNYAIYSADFGGMPGPMADNALAQGFTEIIGFPMFEGSYYLVVSAEGSWDATLAISYMTAPAGVTYTVPPTPFDGEVDIVNGRFLEWTYNDVDAIEYRIVLGNTYPPTDVVMPWTAIDPMGDTYELMDLEPNLQHFWRVDVQNNVGITEGDIWGFTTTITPPQNVVALSEELFEGDAVELSWESPLGGTRALLGYNVYRDGVMINTELVNGLTFDDDAALVYNMAEANGYLYTVTSVFDEGESAHSSPEVEVWFSGNGTLNGNVTDFTTTLDIEGATISLDGEDEFANPVIYSINTDVNGNYTIDVKAGVYEVTVGAHAYVDEIRTPVTVIYNTTTTEDFALLEVPYALASVTATELDEDEVHLEWTFEDAVRELVDFDVYRGLWNQDFATMTYVGSTTQNQFIDYDWGLQTTGVYRWAVVVNYSDNQSDPTYSEPLLDKNMETVVNIEVVLNSAESPSGTTVTLTNISEPYLELVYEATLGADGLFTFDPFRLGEYDVLVSLEGYEPQAETVIIDDVTTLSYLLDEILAPVGDLYVNPNGYATWTGQGEEDFILLDFEDGMPDNFLVSDARLAVADNKLVLTGTDASYASGYYNEMFSDFVFEFELARENNLGYYSTMGCLVRSDGFQGTGSQNGYAFAMTQSGSWWYAKYSNGAFLDWTTWQSAGGAINTGEGEPNIISIEASGSTLMYFINGILIHTVTDTEFTEGYCDVMAYDGDVGTKVMFDDYFIMPNMRAANYNLAQSEMIPGEGSPEKCSSVFENHGTFVKGVEVIPANSDRSQQGFRVWLDNVVSGETGNPWYDYEVEETLVEGEEYYAQVAAIYTTGISNMKDYTFIYHACDYYNSATDFSATRVEGTMDIALAWTNDDSNVDADVFMGTNIYRNGEMYAFVEAGTEMYLDEAVASGDYTYCITQLYESEAQSCEVCDDAIMTPGGVVKGYVTVFDGGAAIENATVAVVGSTDSYVFTTDIDGYYEGEVVEGTYIYTVSADTYETQILEDVIVDFGAIVINDFALLEYPYAVGEVIATELDDNSVLVNWSGQSTGTSEWLIYDSDFVVFDGIGAEAADYSLIWASKWEPAQLTEYGTGYVTKVSVYQSQPQVDYFSEVRILSGDGTSVLYSQDVTGELITGQWNTIELDDAVEFDNTENLWIGMYVERPGGVTNEPTSDALTVISDRYDFFAYNGAAWTSISAEYGITDQAWMLRGFVSTTPAGRAVALDQGDYNTSDRKDYSSVSSVKTGLGMIKSDLKSAKFPQFANQSNRELLGYNVYRGACGAEDEDMTFIGYTLDQQFTDNTWGVAEAGIYSWAIETVYDYNESAFTYSNCLDKDMLTTVSVTVTTNSGDSPEGTDVIFTNVSEPTEPPIVFEIELDATGMHTWDDFRKGTYDILVHLNGFADIMVEDYDIWTPTDIPFILMELLAPPSNLYVTPMGYATWSAGGVVPFEPYLENFNEGLPEDWTIVDGGTTTDTWANVATYNGSSLDGTPFMFVDSDDAGSGGILLQEELISPVILNTENADALWVSWDQNFQWVSSTDFGSVQVFDGDEWVEVLFLQADDPSWPAITHHSIDVTEYANPDFQVKFYYDDDAAWAWYWGVDNFAVTEGEDRYADRELDYYKVFHDYNFITDTDTTFYQYGDNGEVLIPGNTYMAEVAAVYSTGMSAKMFYEWTYYPCDSFPGPSQFTAENVEDTKDVLLIWTDNVAAPDPYFQDFEGGFPPEGWMKANPDGGTGWEALAVGTTPLPGWTGGEATACPDGGAQMAYATWNTGGASSNDQWLISPMLESFTDFELSFYMNVAYGDSYLENVDILISTTGTDVSDFDVVVEEITITSADGWLLYTYAITDYVETGMPMYVAIREHVTDNFNDGAAVMFDNFYYGPAMVRSSSQLENVVAVGGRDVHYVHSPQIDAPYQELILNNREVEDVFVGANLYRDGIMIAEMVQDTFYLDETLVPGYYDYCITYVYESGAHSCGDCIEDVLVPEDCDAPQNLTATLNEETYDDIFLAWNQAVEVEYRYDDGISTGQLGSSGGTLNTLLGNVHRVDAELSEMSWYLTGEGGPHNNISIWVVGLDAGGIPDGNNVLFTSSVSNTDEQWNTFTFNEPLAVTGGFFLGVSYNGFAAIGTDDGTGDPYVFVPNTHYFVSDYTAGGWETWETYNFNVNGMIRATGMEAAVASYVVEPIESDGTSDFTLVKSAEATVTGSPDWANSIVSSNREFTGYNIYRDGNMIVEGYQETTYTDADGLVDGHLYCYEVTSVYSICGESEPSNEACAGYVGIPGIDASEIAIYPNPATSLVNITSSQEMIRISVINYVGQIVYQSDLNNETNLKLNTSSFENGVYVIRMDTENGVVTKRVIITQ